MPLIYITGISGSGKSTVLDELDKQDFITHGVDEEGYADWVDRQTGQIAEFPHEDKNLDIHDWYKKHRWVLSHDRIKTLRDQSDREGKIIFLAGAAEETDAVRHFFDVVVVLVVDAETMKQRIEQRRDNQFGKSPEEMAEILSWLEGFEASYRKWGAIELDGTQPTSEVADQVVRVATKLPGDSTHEE